MKKYLNSCKILSFYLSGDSQLNVFWKYKKRGKSGGTEINCSIDRDSDYGFQKKE